MSYASASPADPAPVVALVASNNEEDFAREQESYRRAMPIQRLLGGGMRHDDATAIHAMSAAGVPWPAAGQWLADRNMRLARAAATRVAKRSYFRFASACYRVAQVAIPTDTHAKGAIHAAMVDAFGEAASLDQPPTEKHQIAWRDGRLCGWLMRPEGIVEPPVVIILGGFDGWREEYWPGARALVRCGIAAFLADGPGQGETRLRHGLFLDADFHQAFSAIADHLLADARLGDAIGIWGNSLGGFLAARTAAADPRFRALCVNGGSARPIELPERFPRFWGKIEALVGSTDRARAIAIMEQLDLTQGAQAITCPLLQLHGTPDQVFLLENAQVIHDQASSADKTLLVWADGDHCIYNHSEEKHLIIADWFASRLSTGGTAAPIQP